MFIAYNCLWTLGLLIGCQILTSKASGVPLLLWEDYGKSSSFKYFNPFNSTTQADFKEIMNKKMENSYPPLLVLVKDDFCNEDILKNQEILADLNNSSVQQLSAVESPVSFFENLSSYEKLTEKDLETIGENQLAIVQVKNVEDALKTFKDIYETSPNLVTVLTGNSCIFSLPDRVRRARQAQVEASNETALFVNFSDGNVLIYASEFPFVKLSGNGSFEQLTSLSNASKVTTGNNSIIVSLIFIAPSDPKITTNFNFSLSGGYYTLASVMYSDSNNTNYQPLFFKRQIQMSQHFSYHCGEETAFQNNSLEVKFKDLQIQLDAKGVFGDAYDCIGFTTIPIWSGIFVTIILGLILIWGLSMIIDIHTMDRFDDPKGKTITISAQE